MSSPVGSQKTMKKCKHEYRSATEHEHSYGYGGAYVFYCIHCLKTRIVTVYERKEEDPLLDVYE